MNARTITEALSGRWHGSYGTALCPAHEDRTPSLSIKDGNKTLLLKCHAGCETTDVIEELKRRNLWEANQAHVPVLQHATKLTNSAHAHVFDNPNREHALAIWNESQPAENTLVETYLRSRCITIPPPTSIRYHPNLKHSPTGLQLPAMVAGVQGPDGKVVAIHRSYLDHTGRKAKVTSPKMALGPITGGAVRLAYAGETLALTEGIEDGLALLQMTGRPTWAALGTSGFLNFNPPDGVQDIVLAPDADPAGDAAVAKAAARFADMGLKVLHLRPPEARDWCDVLADFEERADGGCLRCSGRKRQPQDRRVDGGGRGVRVRSRRAPILLRAMSSKAPASCPGRS